MIFHVEIFFDVRHYVLLLCCFYFVAFISHFEFHFSPYIALQGLCSMNDGHDLVLTESSLIAELRLNFSGDSQWCLDDDAVYITF